MSMEMSFFTSCPLTGGLGVPLQTVRTSNSSLSSRAFVRVRRFEAAYRLIFVRPALERTPGILSVYGIASHFGAIYLCCIIQVWARGMVKKDISMLIHQLISKS
jgi:hypothetical protein